MHPVGSIRVFIDNLTYDKRRDCSSLFVAKVIEDAELSPITRTVRLHRWQTDLVLQSASFCMENGTEKNSRRLEEIGRIVYKRNMMRRDQKNAYRVCVYIMKMSLRKIF